MNIIEMPKLSDTMEEGAISKWLKKEGDFIEEGEDIVEIETDKATMEYASPEQGYLKKILYKSGDSVKLNEPIAILIDSEDEKVDIEKILKDLKKESNLDKITENKISKDVKSNQNEVKKHFIKASPLAKKMAKDMGIDIKNLDGTGPNGRIISKDIKNNDQNIIDTDPSKKITTSSDVIALNTTRKTIAKRLLASKTEYPHFYLKVSANMQKLLDWRKDINNNLKFKEDLLNKISINDILIFVTSKALRKHSIMNSSWDYDQIILHKEINISFALALANGLVAPVIRNADNIGIIGIAKSVRSYLEKAKNSRLSNLDFEGGTFTISNLGMYGIENFIAIINPPQSAILAIGAVREIPWIEESKVVAQKRVDLTLSCDHRIIDGAIGAKFLQTLVDYIENPLNMIV